MSNPFASFDPFAAAPSDDNKDDDKNEPTASTSAPINPFDQFGLQAAQSNLQTAHANITDIWQNVTNSSVNILGSIDKLETSTNNPTASLHSSNNSAASLHKSTSIKKKSYKCIVPYNSPNIETLEKNWDPWLYIATNYSSSQPSQWKNGGNINTYLIIQANYGCCVQGGVESLLKWNKSKGRSSSGNNLDKGESFGDSTSSIGDDATNSSSVTDSNTSTKSTSDKQSIGSSMKFLKSGLKKAQQSIERSVTTMAIKADGGKNRDQLCVSLHYLGGSGVSSSSSSSSIDNNDVRMSMANALGLHINSGELNDVCLSRTEWVELPPPSSSSSDGDEGESKGLLFSIPLCVPDLSFLAQQGSVPLTIRLYLRSGATLLKAVANREYCIGESSLLYSNIMQLMNNSGGGKGQVEQQQQPTKCGSINVPFTTGMLAEQSSFFKRSSFGSGEPAALHITATPRIKFSPPYTFGWTLTDPVSSSPPPLTERQLNWMKMFQLPLDKGYVFQQQQQLPSAPASTLLLANERAVESSLTLPLATACSQLFAQASTVSQTLAVNALKKTRRKEALFLSKEEDEYRSEAIVDTALLDKAALVEVGLVALVLQGDAPGIDCSGFGGGMGEVPSAKTSMSFQPPHTIFEEPLARGSCPLLDESNGAGYIDGSLNAGSFTASGGVKETISTRFCPRILSGLDALLPGVMGTEANGRYVGSIRLEVAIDTANNGPVDNISAGMATNTSVEGLIDLEDYLDNGQEQKLPVVVPALDANTGRKVGTFVLLLRVSSSRLSTSPISGDDTLPSASSGLVSVVGLDTLTSELGLSPYIDNDTPTPNSQLVASPPTPDSIRRRQIATMGSFATTKYMVHQSNIREQNVKALTERYERYNQSLQSGLSTEVTVDDEQEDLPLFERRTPRPFRPSNSRGDPILAGIGFNVHVQSLSLDVLNEGQLPIQAGVTHSVTHGAPADHAKGFGSQEKDGKSKSDDPKGGLRRLELKRLEISKELEGYTNGLINAVGDHFKSRAQATVARQQSGVKGTGKPSRHIPPNLPAITHYRSKAIDCTQRLHSLTWDIAVRRANCFSQALGIAVTCYMSSLSDGGPASRGNASTWARHGYLITFEGLLSAVGKELGMIEDASVAISLLRSVSVVLVSDDTSSRPSSPNSTRVPVPHSPYLKWVQLSSYASHSKSQYHLEIGLEPSYYQSRVPEELKNSAPVRFFPVLFQVGVDIRQWGANAGRNVTSQIKDVKDKPLKSVGNNVESIGELDQQEMDSGGSILDDGDEDVDGDLESDNEIMYVLNVEGYRKMNAYAHSVNPTTPGVTTASASSPVFDMIEQQQQQQAQPLSIHPFLVSHSEAIKTSAGKMEHSVLDRAATACHKMGGGSTVFCKSGKDRTAMQVTFKQAQFVQRYIDRKDGNAVLLEDTPISYDEVFAKSSLMRKHGTRIPICEKNAGEPKFAFNPLQRKFMPEMLRPEASLCQWSKPET